MDYKFDVVLSFAAEQRTEVERVANCLKQAGLKVFYDAYEKADLWGKDLYAHLSDVYENQGKYCIVFASAEYAEKTWTNHERQNAQARALREKGNEYILPVRFDNTAIPGLPATIGYLDYAHEGSSGICEAFLRKISRQQDALPKEQNFVCSASPRALVQSTPLDTIAFSAVIEASWKTDTAEVLLEPDDLTDGGFFDALRRRPDHVIVALGNNAGVCSVSNVEHIIAAGKQRWRISVRLLQSDFSSTFEAGTSNTTADEFAEIRGRRIFLNQDMPKKHQDVNSVMKEVWTQGQGAILKIEGSPFPSLYKTMKNDPQRFLEAAWITSAMQVKLSNTVASIDRLQLALGGQTLSVKFRGARARKYVNVEPYIIEIEGELDLS